MLERIGQIVAATRQRQGMALEALGQEADVSPLSIAALEAGRPGITTAELARIATLLQLDPGSLLRGEELLRRLPSVFARHQGVTDFDHVDDDLLDNALAQGRLLSSLGDQLGDPRGLLRDGRFQRRAAAGDQPAQDGYALARKVRQQLSRATEPLNDIGKLLERRFDVAVLERTLASKVTAICVRDDASAAVILNSRDPDRLRNPAIARVHLAHELCHLLFDPSGGGIHLVLELTHDQRELQSEQRARAFAAELLLPLAGLRAALGEPRETTSLQEAQRLIELARRTFGTPYAITVNHLSNMSFIAHEHREWLEANGGARLPSPKTTVAKEGHPSCLLADRARRAYDAGLLTDGEARDVLLLDRSDPLPWE